MATKTRAELLAENAALTATLDAVEDVGDVAHAL